jgi:mRNA degradation ribonuclease J1/J2
LTSATELGVSTGDVHAFEAAQMRRRPFAGSWNPDIISRGFIHLKDNNMVLDEIRKRVTGLIARLPQDRETESDYIKSLVRDQVGQFVYNKTKRRPMVLPVVIEL